MCLVETWLGSEVLDNEVLIPNYSIVRLDRNRHGGGVAMYIHDSVPYNVLPNGSADLEFLVSLSRNNSLTSTKNRKGIDSHVIPRHDDVTAIIA